MTAILSHDFSTHTTYLHSQVEAVVMFSEVKVEESRGACWEGKRVPQLSRPAAGLRKIYNFVDCLWDLARVCQLLRRLFERSWLRSRPGINQHSQRETTASWGVEEGSKSRKEIEVIVEKQWTAQKKTGVKDRWGDTVIAWNLMLKNKQKKPKTQKCICNTN